MSRQRSSVSSQREKLFSIVTKRLRDQAEAEDVVQDTFAEFFEAYDLGLAIESLGAWLVRVAQNKIADRFRKRKSEKGYLEFQRQTQGNKNSAEGPDSELTRAWLRQEIVNALEILPKNQSDVFVMHELEGKSFEEIASLTGEKLNTLLARKRYAIKFLREYLKEVYDELE